MAGIPEIVVLVLAAVAAFTDARKGEIPNWLTMPAIVIAPVALGFVDGGGALLYSVIGLLLCGIAPLFLYYLDGGMAGGDVKLFLAIGAVGGVTYGLEIQFLSVIAASIYALGQLAWNGKLLFALRNTFFVGFGRVLPRRWRRAIPHELMHRIRLGPAILLGAIIATLGHHPEIWP
jgi:prepilin peptidase CpaA